MWRLALTFGTALAASWMLTHLAVRVAHWFDILDHPDQERKRHDRAMPRTGGLALCLTILGGFTLLNCQRWQWEISAWHPPRFVLLLGVSTLLLCALGLWDDKFGMQARTKFLWQTLAIVPFVCWGRSTTAVDVFGVHLDATWLTIPLVLFWLVSCTNFVNLIDGLDGLAGTVGLIVALAVAFMAGLDQLTEVSLLAMVVAGALLGFLIHNWPPARIFMGDSGSLPLGFLVGALSLEASAKKAAGMTLAVPLVLLCVPMFDTSMAILRRKLNGRNIGQGDRAHIHHCLRDRGLSPTQTLLAISGLCVATALAAILSTVLDSALIAVAAGGTLVVFLIAGRVFGFNETRLLLRHLRAAYAFLRGAPQALRIRFAIARLADAVEAGEADLWLRVVSLAQRIPGLEVELVCEHLPSDRELFALVWPGDSPLDRSEPCWKVSYSVQREGGLLVRGEVRGLLRAEDDSPVHQELAELLGVLCRDWPIDVPASLDRLAEGDEAGADVPHVLSHAWPASANSSPKGVALGALERDAA